MEVNFLNVETEGAPDESSRRAPETKRNRSCLFALYLNQATAFDLDILKNSKATAVAIAKFIDLLSQAVVKLSSGLGRRSLQSLVD